MAEIRIFPDSEAMSRGAAELFAAEARRAATATGRFTVLMAGGTTPKRCYQLLAHSPSRESIPWELVHFFWGDERCVSADDRRSNARMARLALLDHVPVPEGQIHPIRCHGNPRDGAAAYEQTLRSCFPGGLPRFDLVLLGVGTNGHTASLFPDSPALAEQERWTAAVHVPEEDLHRVTVTFPVINNAAVIAFLVAGEEKAEIVREVLEGGADTGMPARLVRPEGGKVLWLLDLPAARQLSHE